MTKRMEGEIDKVRKAKKDLQGAMKAKGKIISDLVLQRNELLKENAELRSRVWPIEQTNRQLIEELQKKNEIGYLTIEGHVSKIQELGQEKEKLEKENEYLTKQLQFYDEQEDIEELYERFTTLEKENAELKEKSND